MARIDQTEACRRVLIEVGNVLGAFRDEIVVVGGWVPELRYPGRGHIGSLDVDLAVSPRALSENVYATIYRRMLDAGFTHLPEPSRFMRDVAGAEPVKVDLISGQYAVGEKATLIRVNELRVNTLRGLDLAFEACDEMEIAGSMPDGTRNTVRVQVVRPEAYILIKAFALDERKKEKDAYDIAFVLHHYQPDLRELATRVAVMLAGGLARDAYAILKAKFATLDSVGPVWAEQALTGTGYDPQQARRAAFEDAQTLFRFIDAAP